VADWLGGQAMEENSEYCIIVFPAGVLI